MTTQITEIAIIAETKIIEMVEGKIEVEINIGIIPEMTEEIQEETKRGKFNNIWNFLIFL